MRNTLVLTLFLISSCLYGQESIEVMSFNIRYNSPNDGVNIWPNRKDKVAEIINYHKVDAFGLQEATKIQLDDLDPLIHSYKWIGVGRDDGKEKGEFSPIFYNPKKLTLGKNGTFWLSEVTDKPNKGWDAALPRIATYAFFTTHASKDILIVNTHYDHRGSIAREKSSLLIVKKVQELNPEGIPTIIMGDFNATPDQNPITNYIENGFKHARITKPEVHMGPIGTFSGFKSKEQENHEIDHIFFKGKLDIQRTATLSPTWGGLFASDHHPVLAKLIFQ